MTSDGWEVCSVRVCMCVLGAESHLLLVEEGGISGAEAHKAIGRRGAGG